MFGYPNRKNAAHRIGIKTLTALTGMFYPTFIHS